MQFPSPIFPIIPALLLAGAHANELTLERKPFFVTHTLSAYALPSLTMPIKIEAEEWNTFEIENIIPHGTLVSKDEILVSFKSQAFNEKQEDLTRAVALQELELAKAKQELAVLEKTVPEQLAIEKRAAEEAAEELQYFLAVDRRSQEEKAGMELKRREQTLASFREELKQLQQMYEADDLTEETEEIILQKQKDYVEMAEFALRMETLDHKRKLEVSLPRQEQSLIESRDEAALKLETAQTALPRELEIARSNVAQQEVELQRKRDTLLELEAEKAFLEIRATINGTFYYGSFEDGSWKLGEQAKKLKQGGMVQTGTIFATLIPETADPVLRAFSSQEEAITLEVGMTGIATPLGNGSKQIPVTLDRLANNPDINKRYVVVFKPEATEALNAPAGRAYEVRVISYAADEVISVPTDALIYGANGWAVEVKLADGSTEQRPVLIGRSNDKFTEVVSGLEEGQVVTVP